MPGMFTVGESKSRPGVYHRYTSSSQIATADAVNGIGAALIRASWGPMNQVVELDVSTNPEDLFGAAQTVDTVEEMLKGGCSKVLAVRIGTGGTAGSLSLKDNAESAEDVVTITARHVGSRAFTVTIQESLIKNGVKECRIYEGTKEVEKVEFAAGSGEPDALVAALENSPSFVAKKLADGSGVLQAVTQAAMTAGTDPTTATADYSTGLDILEASRWNVLCVDTEDAAIHALIAAYVTRIEAAGSYPLACVAEKTTVDLDTRMSHAADFNDSKMHYVLNAVYEEHGQVLDGYRLAARIGGMIAAVSAATSLTHTAVPGTTGLAEPLTNTQVERALASGCLCMTASAAGDVWVESAINTLITPADNQDDGWKKIRRVKTRYELMDRITSTVDPLIGRINNDANGRATIVSAAQGVINSMVSEGKLQEGGTVQEDESNPAKSDSAWFTITVDDNDSVERIYLTFRFRFSAE